MFRVRLERCDASRVLEKRTRLCTVDPIHTDLVAQVAGHAIAAFLNDFCCLYKSKFSVVLNWFGQKIGGGVGSEGPSLSVIGSRENNGLLLAERLFHPRRPLNFAHPRFLSPDKTVQFTPTQIFFLKFR